ncbi:MAG: hypothetical protein WD993_03405 [Thermoleophilaceae bacterium]
MDVTVPYWGWFWISVWLEDAAGNVDSNAKSQAVMLRFDQEAPPEPALVHDGEWLDATTPTDPAFVIELATGASWPVSKLRGYSVTLDGSLPDADVEALAAQDDATFPASHSFLALPEGVTDVRLRSVSNAGVPSDLATAAQIRLDRSPPTVAAHGLPDSGTWQRQPVVVELAGTDQPGLSGMGAAPLDRPVDEGGHLSYRLGDGPAVLVRGGNGQLQIASDGHHTLTYRAFDVAGNASTEGSAKLKIDRTPPAGSFHAPSPTDPQLVTATVLDATSGVAGGRIEYRRDGAGAFTALPTEHAVGELRARLDDSALPAGSYELRAVATDVAGNEAAIGRSETGAAMTLALPLRSSARLEAVARVKRKRCTAKRRRGARRSGARRRVCRTRTRTVAAGEPVALAHGQRLRSVGHLATAAGLALAHVRVKVEGQLRSGGPFATLGTATTDALGNFRFTVPPGPSRTLRFRFAGSGTVRPAAASLVTEVRAAARLKVDRRRLRNGQAVRFSGRLLGRPIPAAGKVVALQARVGPRWRTFATPRANARGAFRHRYRFTSTTGVRRYAFRAVVTPEAAYPYERGASRTVRVVVRGR